MLKKKFSLFKLTSYENLFITAVADFDFVSKCKMKAYIYGPCTSVLVWARMHAKPYLAHQYLYMDIQFTYGSFHKSYEVETRDFYQLCETCCIKFATQ